MITRKDISDNLYCFYKEFGKLNGVMNQSRAGTDFVMMPGGKWPSYILGSEHADRLSMKKIAEKMKLGELPAFWITETFDESDFEDIAWENGIRQAVSWTGMEMEISSSLEDGITREDIQAEVVEDREGLAEWIKIIQNELLTGKKVEEDYFKDLAGSPSVTIFGLKEKGIMVSTLLGFQLEETVGIYFVATDRTKRKMGFGSMITSWSVNHYFNQGIRKFVLHSTNLGHSMYSKLGFRDVNTYGVFWMTGKY